MRDFYEQRLLLAFAQHEDFHDFAEYSVDEGVKTKSMVNKIPKGAVARKTIAEVDVSQEISGEYIKHYSGELGEFDYDIREFNFILRDYFCGFKEYYLCYIGTETDGSKIKIPVGIVNSSFMFYGCSFLKTSPVIPFGVKDCTSMFEGCKSLIKAPIIPDGVEFCNSMFRDCKSLTKASVIPNGVFVCKHMFENCVSLKTFPVIPCSVKIVDAMWAGCSAEVQEAAKWNYLHRGQSLDIYTEFKSSGACELCGSQRCDGSPEFVVGCDKYKRYLTGNKIIEDLENARQPVKASGRISKDEYYLRIAEAVLQRSTCLRRKYGAVIVQNDVIIATGYNGSPRGMKNCCDTGLCEREKHNVPKGERYELCVAIHAEDNAITAAGREKCLGATLYICGMEMDGSYAKPDPCLMCNRKILNSGISKVIGRGKDDSVLEIPIVI